MFAFARKAFLIGVAGLWAVGAFGVQPQPIQEVDFGIDPSNGPFGLTPSGVQTEAATPLDRPWDDFYAAWPLVAPLTNVKTLDENIPGLPVPPGDPPPTVTPALCLGRAQNGITDDLCFGSQTFLHQFDPSDLNSMVLAGAIYVQFCVQATSVGLPLSAVNQEQPSEEGGDVFQSLPGGSNILLVDEELSGLPPHLANQSENDMNALVMPCVEGTPLFQNLPHTIDTDNDQAPDTPLVFFTVWHNSAGHPGARILTPGTQQVRIAWEFSDLGLTPGDDIDALYIELPFGAGPGQPNLPWIFFSLRTGSPSLAPLGADPGDILLVIPGKPAFIPVPVPPVFGPIVVIRAGALGLRGVHSGAQADDDLNAVHMTFTPFAPLPKQYLVTFETDGTPSATLDGDTSQTVNHGDDCTSVTANAPMGYHFVKWTKGGPDYSTDNPLTVTNVTENMALVANFAINQYSVTFATDGTPGATLDGNPAQTVNHGDDCTAVTANAPASYHFIKWTKGASDYSTDNPLTVTNVTEDMALVANFAVDPTQLIQEVDFGIDTENPPHGIAPSGVRTEAATQGETAVDDFYAASPLVTPGTNVKTLDENVPGLPVPPGDPPPTVTPALCLGRGQGEVTDALCFGRQTILDGGNPFDLDSMVSAGMVSVQFCVETNSVGLPATAVNQEQATEEGGDVFQSAPGGSNILLVDEELSGLPPHKGNPSENDMNALVMPCVEGTPMFQDLKYTPAPPWPVPHMVDTDNDQVADTPLVFFSVKSSQSHPGADILAPGTQQVQIAWMFPDLGLGPADDIDALYIELPFGEGPTPPQFPWIFFSLSAGSPSLGPLNADPGDILLVIPGKSAFVPIPAPPVFGPIVVIHAGTLGLRGVHSGAQADDDLNGLHITFTPFEPLPKPPPDDPGLVWKKHYDHYLPDFDQKQDAWSINRPLPGPPWTWCGPVAEANSLWWFDYPYPTLVDDSLTTPGGLIEELATRMQTDVGGSGTSIANFYTGVKQYLQNHDPTSNVELHWVPDTGNDTMPVPAPTFPQTAQEIIDCQDVTLLLGFYRVMETPEWLVNPQTQTPGWFIRFWRVGGHFVSCAGTSTTLSLVALSDPSLDSAVLGGPGVVRGTQHATPADHNDDANASHDIYIVDTPPFGPNGAFRLVDYPGQANAQSFEDINGVGHEVDVWDMVSPGPPTPPPVQASHIHTFVDRAVAVSRQRNAAHSWTRYESTQQARPRAVSR